MFSWNVLVVRNVLVVCDVLVVSWNVVVVCEASTTLDQLAHRRRGG